MDSEDLRALVETARRGSFSLAAEALGLSQSAVSRRIGRLEQELGIPLMERLRPAATPTRHGLMVLDFAERTLREWDELRAASPASPLTGVLHVAASTTPGEHLVPALLAEFGHHHARVRAQMHVMNSDSVEECVRTRHCDVGFLGRPPRGGTLHSIAVAEEEIVLAVPARHPLANRGQVEPQDLTDEVFVTREPGSGTEATVRSVLAAAGAALPPHRVALEVSTPQALLSAVAAGQGIGFVSGLALADAESHGIATVRLRDLPLLRRVVLVYHPRRLAPAADAFVRFVQSRLPLCRPCS